MTIRLIVITDEPMPVSCEDQQEIILPVIHHLWSNTLQIDPMLRSVINTSFSFTYLTRYVSFYMEDQADDSYPVYLVYIPQGAAVKQVITCLRKEFFVRLWPNQRLRASRTATEEISAFIFALARNFEGRIINLTYTDDFIVYKATSETMAFRDYFFQQARKCLKSVK